jgi:hypothetical protein
MASSQVSEVRTVHLATLMGATMAKKSIVKGAMAVILGALIAIGLFQALVTTVKFRATKEFRAFCSMSVEDHAQIAKACDDLINSLGGQDEWIEMKKGDPLIPAPIRRLDINRLQVASDGVLCFAGTPGRAGYSFHWARSQTNQAVWVLDAGCELKHNVVWSKRDPNFKNSLVE